MPISLTDVEMAVVMDAARPLDVKLRDAFLRRVFDELAACDAVGPGVVYRACLVAQREFFDPPSFNAERPLKQFVSRRRG